MHLKQGIWWELTILSSIEKSVSESISSIRATISWPKTAPSLTILCLNLTISEPQSPQPKTLTIAPLRPLSFKS